MSQDKINASTGTVSAGVVVNETVPDTKVNLRFLLVSGKKTDMYADVKDTIETIKKAMYEAWPREWSNDIPASYTQMRIVYLGRILDNSSTIESCKIPLGQTTIVHLLLSGGNNTGPSSSGDKKQDASSSETGGCCVIL